MQTLIETAAENEVKSLRNRLVEVIAKAPDYQMADMQAKVKVGKLGDTRKPPK